jgi:hypothetical protein
VHQHRSVFRLTSTAAAAAAAAGIALGCALTPLALTAQARATRGGNAGSGAVSAAAAITRSEVPTIVTRGFERYQQGDLSGALDLWLTGSPIVGNGSAKAQMLGGLAPVESAYGAVLGHDIVDVVDIGAHVRRVYAVVRLERGPLYVYFECYQTGDTGTWIVPTLMFNTKVQDIFPAAYWAR